MNSFENKAGHARELCNQGLWPEVLAFAQKWHAESPAATALFYQGVGAGGAGAIWRGARRVTAGR